MELKLSIVMELKLSKMSNMLLHILFIFYEIVANMTFCDA